MDHSNVPDGADALVVNFGRRGFRSSNAAAVAAGQMINALALGGAGLPQEQGRKIEYQDGLPLFLGKHISLTPTSAAPASYALAPPPPPLSAAKLPPIRNHSVDLGFMMRQVGGPLSQPPSPAEKGLIMLSNEAANREPIHAFPGPLPHRVKQEALESTPPPPPNGLSNQDSSTNGLIVEQPSTTSSVGSNLGSKAEIISSRTILGIKKCVKKGECTSSTSDVPRPL